VYKDAIAAVADKLNHHNVGMEIEKLTLSLIKLERFYIWYHECAVSLLHEGALKWLPQNSLSHVRGAYRSFNKLLQGTLKGRDTSHSAIYYIYKRQPLHLSAIMSTSGEEYMVIVVGWDWEKCWLILWLQLSDACSRG